MTLNTETTNPSTHAPGTLNAPAAQTECSERALTLRECHTLNFRTLYPNSALNIRTVQFVPERAPSARSAISERTLDFSLQVAGWREAEAHLIGFI